MTSRSCEPTRLLEAGMRSWPAGQTHPLDGWYLRQSADVSKRANSVCPLRQEGALSLAERIERCEAWYSNHGQRALFQVPSTTLGHELDQTLEQRNYQVLDPSSVHTLALNEQQQPAAGILLEHRPVALVMNAISPATIGSEARRARAELFRAIRKPMNFAIACQDGQPVAGGLVVVDGELAGIFCMHTSPFARRQGLALQILDTLLAWGGRFGAKFAYLQVERSNSAACQLYRKRGFAHGFDYHYRLAEPEVG